MSALYQIAVALLAGLVMLCFHIVIIALGCVVYLYFLPGVIAMKRSYPGANRIFLVCALTAWTAVGWIGALAFALTLQDRSGDADPVLNY